MPDFILTEEADNEVLSRGTDEVTGLGGDDIIDGAGAEDVSIYRGNFADYQIRFRADGKVQVTDSVEGRDGSDLLTSIEAARFADKQVSLQPGQDVVIVIDQSGSMSDDIKAIERNASDLADVIFDEDNGLLDSRLAFVTYERDPDPVLTFTDQADPVARKDAALDAINGIPTFGGTENVARALLYALDGSLGEWRPEASARRIFLFTDEPGDDRSRLPEVYTLAANVADGNGAVVPVEIITIAAGGSSGTTADVLAKIASKTGGQALTSTSASDLVNVLLGALTSATEGDDTIIGTLRDNRIEGLGGDDTLKGRGGNDTLLGGDGNDILSGGDGDDLVRGGPGNDTIEGDAGIDEVRGGPGNDLIDGNRGDDLLDGGNGKDTLLGGIDDDVVLGRSGNDRVSGNSGNDQVWGGDGDDFVLGRDGLDDLRGGPGGDRLLGGEDADRIWGGTGADTANGGNGNDSIFGRDGNDRLGGGAGDDTLSGQRGADIVRGGSGADTLSGGLGADLLRGGSDADALAGGAGDDRLIGNRGQDVLVGGNGDDVLIGGWSKDTLTGDDGADNFMFNTPGHAGRKIASRDVITDFDRAEGDRIDLSGMDASVSADGDQAFAFIATAAFSGTESELRYVQVSGKTIVRGDIDGDGIKDFSIVLTGLHALTEGDFVL